MHSQITRLWLVLGVFLGLAACGPGEAEPEAEFAATAVPAQEGFRDFGDYEVHYRAMNTADLRPEVALEYGISRADNRAMLTISVIEQRDDGLPGSPVHADVDVRVTNILARTQELRLREITDGEAVYYIGEWPFADEDVLTFEVRATPAGTNERLALSFRQQFFAD